MDVEVPKAVLSPGQRCVTQGLSVDAWDALVLYLLGAQHLLHPDLFPVTYSKKTHDKPANPFDDQFERAYISMYKAGQLTAENFMTVLELAGEQAQDILAQDGITGPMVMPPTLDALIQAPQNRLRLAAYFGQSALAA